LQVLYDLDLVDRRKAFDDLDLDEILILDKHINPEIFADKSTLINQGKQYMVIRHPSLATQSPAAGTVRRLPQASHIPSPCEA
jgi:hypothetical protein